MRIAPLIKQDIKYQFRNGIHLIYAILTVFYIIILRLIPEVPRQYAGIFMLFTDTGVIGFFFIGALVMMERNEQIFEALFITPVKINEYILSKVISLSALSFVCSVVIYTASAHVTAGGLAAMISAVLLSSVLFTILGIGFSVIAPSLNHYFMYSMVLVLFLIPAIIEYIGLFSTPLIYLLPTAGPLYMISYSYSGGNFGELLVAGFSSVPWIIASFVFIRRMLGKLISMRIGEKSWIKL